MTAPKPYPHPHTHTEHVLTDSFVDAPAGRVNFQPHLHTNRPDGRVDAQTIAAIYFAITNMLTSGRFTLTPGADRFTITAEELLPFGFDTTRGISYVEVVSTAPQLRRAKVG
jgi:hypothetical protein